MKLVSYTDGQEDEEVKCGILCEGVIYDVYRLLSWARREGFLKGFESLQGHAMMDLLHSGREGMDALKAALSAITLNEALHFDSGEKPLAIRKEEAGLRAPLPLPRSLRDFYSFEAHVKKARLNRGLDMVPEWYHFPAFYFSNHNAVLGPGEELVMPPNTRKLDYELEVACAIGREGRDIRVCEADDYIAGYMVMNDWSARDLQADEMKVGLGPAKGKDFATSLGPCLVTPEDLEDRKEGDRYRLSMEARVNGRLLSSGNLVDIYWTFPRMIARASESAWLYPGDVLGSGTVGTGCILELGEDIHQWLQPGDVVELTVEMLGTLSNRIRQD